MSRILIAYATNEGQTDKITETLAEQWRALGHVVLRASVANKGEWPDPAQFDGVLVAASVHASRHQHNAARYVSHFVEALTERGAAFLSVSMSAAATKAVGRRLADTQVQKLLDATGWRPSQAATIAGAYRLSRLRWWERWIARLLMNLSRKELDRLGWPEDLTRDAEYTDWNVVRRFGEDFVARLHMPERQPSSAA